MQSLRATYGNKLRIVWKNLPLAFHHNAAPAAAAALAAGEQGKFWEMHDLLFANQADLSPELYERLAGDLKLDLVRFRRAFASASTQRRVEADLKAAAAAGANGTPTFFINGRRLTGAQPIGAFAAIIDRDLTRTPSPR